MSRLQTRLGQPGPRGRPESGLTRACDLRGVGAQARRPRGGGLARESWDVGSGLHPAPARRRAQAPAAFRAGRQAASPTRPARSPGGGGTGSGPLRGPSRREAQPPPRSAHLEVVAAEVHAAHERQHSGGLHGGAALAARPAGGRAGGGVAREPRAGWGRPRPLTRPRPEPRKRWAALNSASGRLRNQRGLRESERRRARAGGTYSLQASVAASRVEGVGPASPGTALRPLQKLAVTPREILDSPPAVSV